jgi:hypothetical protein
MVYRKLDDKDLNAAIEHTPRRPFSALWTC